MTNNFFFGISLTASFLAGVLALFAPCCITFLFPSYLGTIFKEGKKVMFYTLIFALGLAVILIPVALGFRLLVFFFDNYHQEIYYLGGLFLILMGTTTLKPIFNLHLPFFQGSKLSNLKKDINIFSIFSLGVMSGLSSSCCAPVLLAAVTLTTLSPTLFQALIVSLAYVLGIVFPLFLLSLFYEKLTDKISGKNRQRIYQIFQILGGGIFILSGVIIIIANYLKKIEMYQMEGYSKSFRLAIFQIAKFFQNSFVDLISFFIIVFIFYQLLKTSK